MQHGLHNTDRPGLYSSTLVTWVPAMCVNCHLEEQSPMAYTLGFDVTMRSSTGMPNLGGWSITTTYHHDMGVGFFAIKMGLQSFTPLSHRCDMTALPS